MSDIIIECGECERELDECKCAMCPNDKCIGLVVEPKLDMCKSCGFCTIYAHCKLCPSDPKLINPVIANKGIKSDSHFCCGFCGLPLDDDNAGPVVFTGLTFICNSCSNDTGDPDPTPPMYPNKESFPIQMGDLSHYAFIKKPTKG